MINEQLDNKKYDLAERTSVFSKNLIELCKSVELDKIGQVLVLQVVRSATSIGANYMEATNGSSKRDFINKINTCKKEAQETKYWLRLLIKVFKNKKLEIDNLLRESHELLLIFQKIISSSKNSKIEN